MLKRILLGLVMLVFIVIAYNLTSQIFNTLKSGDRLSEATNKLTQLETENKELKKRLEKVQSQEFVEQQARDKLGLAKEGETIVIIPDEKLDQILEASREAKIVRLPNWLGWWKVFF